MVGLDRRASLTLGLLTDYSRLREHGFLAHPSLRMVVKDGPGLLAAYVDWGARERECILHGYRVDRCAEERCIAFLIAGACARRKNAAHSDHCIGYKEARHECSTP